MSYFGGVPQNVLSDNMKQFVQRSNRYEPVFTEVCEQWALHYHTTLSAARVSKPKDKPSVENTVNIAYLRVYAPLRNETFYSLGEQTIAYAILDRIVHDAHRIELNGESLRKRYGMKKEMNLITMQ